MGDAIVAGDTPVTGAPVCRLIWRGESIEVVASESVIGRDRGCAVQIDAEIRDRPLRAHDRRAADKNGRSMIGSNGTKRLV